ncbi:MAG: hypothetical protein JWP97_2683 [Labilithrix sp.]|nr:hypothetical protein [Labilithrix sp.]
MSTGGRGVRRLAALLAFVAVLLAAACDDTSAVKEAAPDAATTAPRTDGGAGADAATTDAGSSDCFMNPTTHFEIINACTSAQKIIKNPTLPRLLPDGGLPPLS